MANYATLKAAINAVIKANGNKEITGTVLNETLTAMVNSLGANYQFAGVATPSTNPGTPDQNVFYLAGQAGTYTNFNSIVLPNGLSILKWNGSWSGETVLAGDGVFDISAYKATGGTLATFADLSAALDGGNNIPSALRKGGMSVKFVQRSDNNYIQARLMANAFTIDITKWQVVDDEPTAGSHNLVESGGVRKTIYGLTFGPGTSNCTLVSGNKYLLKNTGTVAYNVGYYYNETSTTIANLKIGESIEFTSPYNISQIWISSITGAKLTIFDLNDASYKIEIAYDLATNDALKVDNIVASLYDEQILAGQTVAYKMKAGHTYCFKNTGTALGGVYYRVSSSSEDVGISAIAVGNTIEFTATVDSGYLLTSSISGFSVEVYEKDSIFEAIEKNKENIADNTKEIYYIEHDIYSYTVQPGALLPYKMISGHTYCFRNIGTAFGGVYYRVTADGAYTGIGTVPVGQTIEFTATVDSNFLETSQISGLAIEVYEKGSIYQKLMGSEKPFTIKVCSYNLGDFSGEGLVTPSDAGSLAYRKLIGSLGANIIGTQEDMLYYGGDSGMSSGESVRDVIFGMYKNYYRYGNTQYNFKAFASDYTITDIQQVNYTDDTFTHPWFLKGLLNSDILVVSLHFDWQDITRRRKQINQLISYCSGYDKVILIGDTNPSNYVNGEKVDPAIPEIHAEDWAYFTNAGYTMANGGLFGDFGTCAELVGGVVEFRPYDNIFVKGGFIREVEVITADYMNDHKPIIATVVF